MQGKAFNSMSYPFACTIKETVNPQPWFRGTVHVQFIFPITLLFFFFFFSQGHLRSRQEGRQMHQLGNCNLLLADLFSVKFRHSNLHSSCWALLLNLPDPLRLPEGSQELSEEHRASCCCCQGRTPTGGHNFQQALAVFNKLCQLFLITGCSVLWL